MPTTTTITHTTLGTPCARTWSADWIATINAKESELNHRICGARLYDATPCTNTSNHPSGRCPHHGGFDLTGAPPGNRNHTIHGLYSRRLRSCTKRCPHWQTCPLANAQSTTPSPSISSIPSIPPNPDLTCPYQLVEYNTVLTDALAIAESQPHPNPMAIHLAHNVALLQVLISNAATHLTNPSHLSAQSEPDKGARASRPCSSSSSSDPESRPCDSEVDFPNPNAINAFIRLMREFRASLKMLAAHQHHPLNRQKQNTTPPTPESFQRHTHRMKHDIQLDPDSIAETQVDLNLPQTHARAYLQQSIQAASQGNDVEMCEAFDNAAQLDEPLAQSERDHVLASYRPAKQSISEELAQQILGNLHLPALPAQEETEKDTPTSEMCEQKPHHEDTKFLNEYLDLFREGKIPPEAFPIDTPIRTHAEKIFTRDAT
ncbi:MAG: hypothetical protein IT366_15630 [Candidatus Hydrogenedentes bacterium]|nr:hypothetical protein [Candidatus Hydrogenedentota bacterium]